MLMLSRVSGVKLICFLGFKFLFPSIAGSPAIYGDREEDGDTPSDSLFTSENQNDKQKVAERMLSWHMTYGRGEDIVAPNYDKEVSHNHIPLLTHSVEVCRSYSEYRYPLEHYCRHAKVADYMSILGFWGVICSIT